MGLALRVAGLLLTLLLLGGCGLLPDGPVTSPGLPGTPEPPRGLPYQYQAVERSLRFEFGPDGVLRLTQDLIFDAGADGIDQHLVGYVAPILLDIDDDTRQQITPLFSAESAVDTTDPANPIDLLIERAATRSDDGFQYLITTPGGWTPGRHLVRFTAQIDDVWRTMPDGAARLVLPNLSIYAPWYPYEDALAFTTISATETIMCMGNQGRNEPCNPTEPTLVGIGGPFPGLGSAGHQPRYYFVTPRTVTAQPAPFDEVRR